jgi:hypothetical protein
MQTMNVGELLQMYASILAEFRRRGLTRTNNAPIGDLAEYAALLAYGGHLAANSAKSYDLTAADGRRIQVKVRSVDANKCGSRKFSVIRTFDFDATVFIVVDAETSTLQSAFEWTPEEVQTHGSRSEHTNGHTIRISQLPSAGTDVTEVLREAWELMLDSVGEDQPASTT